MGASFAWPTRLLLLQPWYRNTHRIGMHTSDLTSFLLVRYVKYAVTRSLLRLVIIRAMARPAGDLGNRGDASCSPPSGNTSDRYSFTTRDSYTLSDRKTEKVRKLPQKISGPQESSRLRKLRTLGTWLQPVKQALR